MESPPWRRSSIQMLALSEYGETSDQLHTETFQDLHEEEEEDGERN